MAKMQHRQRQGRGDHRQAAPRPDRHRAARSSRAASRASPTWRAISTCRSGSSERERHRQPCCGSPPGRRAVVRARRAHRRPRRPARQLGAPQPGLRPGGMCRRHQGRRLRPGAGADRQGAHQRGLQDLLRRQRRRGPGRARGAARRHHLRARRPAARRRGRTTPASTCAPCSRACPRRATGPPTAARAGAGWRRRSTSTPA